MLHCDYRSVRVRTATAKRPKLPQVSVLAKQTHDEESRARYLRLEQMYLQLADTEERAGAPAKSASGDSNLMPAA
jgi:hypothetical protein